MKGNKKCDLVRKKRMIGARKIAGIGTRVYKLSIVPQVLGKLVLLSDMTKN